MSEAFDQMMHNLEEDEGRVYTQESMRRGLLEAIELLDKLIKREETTNATIHMPDGSAGVRQVDDDRPDGGESASPLH